MTPVLPGIGSLGQGFDIFGRYDDSSLKVPLFDFNVGEDSGIPIKSPKGDDYLRPANTQVNFAANPGHGRALAFLSREDYSEHLELKADIKAKYRAFSGAFSFVFNKNRKEESSFSYALYEYEKQIWSIQIVDSGADNLAQYVLDDPAFKEIPKQYTPDNAYLFFRFFHKYGTHFVRSVDVGARMNYCVTVKRSFLSDKTTIETKLDAEIEAAFLSGSAQVAANWAKAGKEWTEQRQVAIDAVGGDNKRLTLLRPGYEETHKAEFDEWLNTLETRPGTINYRLSPIEELFPGDQTEQVRRAAEAYANSQLQVVSEAQDCAILLNGARVDMQTKGTLLPQAPTAVIKIAVINGDTLQLVHGCAYRLPNLDFTALVNDVRQYEKDDKYIVAIALGSDISQRGPALGYPGTFFPTGDFYAFLLGCGGGEAVSEWHDKYHHASGDFTDRVSFAFVGCCGAPPNSGVGTLGHNQPPSNKVPPRVEARAFLRPVGMGGGMIRFKPQET